MGVLLERARRVFGGGPRELPLAEPFELTCACGNHVSGFRQDHRQFVPCPGCGQILFVLPVSPYPAPTSREVSREAGRAEVEQKAATRPWGVRFRVGLRRARRRALSGIWRFVPPKRWFSPVRLLVVGMVLAVAGTTALTLYYSRRGNLTRDILVAREAWEDALRNGDFDMAGRQLGRATAAIRRYGSRDRQFGEIEQLAKEVAIFADLLKDTDPTKHPLEDVLHRVRSMSPQQSAEYLRDTLHNPSLLLELHVSAEMGPEALPEGRRYCKLFVGAEAARLDMSTLKLIQNISRHLPSQVFLGARIQSVERMEDSQEWVIHLAPDSGVLLTSWTCLEKAGWPLDEATRSQLETQAQWVFGQP